MSKFEFKGLRANNLLAFMAALGALRVATVIWPKSSPMLAWEEHDDGWYATLWCDETLSREQFIEGLVTGLKVSGDMPAMRIGDDLRIPVSQYHDYLHDASRNATPAQRSGVDLLAAYGSDAVECVTNGKPTGTIADTALRTMSGAGHQHFLGTMRTLVVDTGSEHLEAALFTMWTYSDPVKNHSMRWDPVDDVRYALQWDEPSGDPTRKTAGCMWGANRLAIEALPLFSTAPTSNGLTTTSFIERPGSTEATWPVWCCPVGLETVSSLLDIAELSAEAPDQNLLARRGIKEVFRCRRITQGKFRNFTSARPA
jgi:hypothetical protein